jgi:uncharacterized protein
VRLALTPRTTEFYDLFARAGENAVAVARLAKQRFEGIPDSAVRQTEIKALEHAGDDVTREIVQLLNTQYITPFDREDIYALAQALDDVVDHIDEACDLLELYAVEQPARHALEQCRILVAAVEQLARALSSLKGMRGVQDALVQVKRMEDEGDRISREAIGSLFQDPRIDPLVVIRWKDIFESLEDALDACETAANVLGNIVVKNA